MSPNAEKLVRCLEHLPADLQAELLHYAEYLCNKAQETNGDAEADTWSTVSLSAAMRGFEHDDMGYTLSDLKERF